MKRFGLLAVCAMILFVFAVGCAGDGSGDVGGAVADAAADAAPPTSDETGEANGRDDPAPTDNGNAGNGGDPGNAGSGGNDNPGEAPPPLSFDADMGVEVNGAWFPIWQDASGLIAALGDDYEFSSAPSCVFDVGDDKEFAYDGIFVNTNPLEGIDLWFVIYIENDSLSTARGIRVGDTLDDIFAVYDDGHYWDDDTTLVYSISGVPGDISSPCVLFTILDGRVTAIEIYYPTNTV